ncbi:MAG: DUF92 domain-containing protein [candidate division KSB1 bacterium]|nr:DUF92 domain-containing protein [candidate division KSB1 bacterium]
MSDWVLLPIFFFALVALIGLAEVVRRLLGGSAEITRKAVHVLTGVLVAGTPFIFRHAAPMALLGGVFVVVNLVGVQRGFFKSMHGTTRRTYGTVFYPLAFLILLAVLWQSHKTVFVAAMLIMAFADAAAAVVGENLPHPREYLLGAEKKSVEGSTTMFLVTFAVVVGSLLLLGPREGIVLGLPLTLWVAAVVAVVATMCEAVSALGSDNLSVPLGAAFVMHYMLTHTGPDRLAFSAGLGLALVVAVASVRAGFLKASGAALTFILATLVFGVGRWPFAVPILTFFVLSSLLSRLGEHRKQLLVANAFAKVGPRDFGQVFANGGVAGILLLVWHYFPQPVWYVLYVASLVAVTADTWGTELGVLGGQAPRSILTWRRLPVGSSGGITLWGTLGGALGAAVVAGSAALMGAPHRMVTWTARALLVLVLVGVGASLVDSLIGATVQGQYRCTSCGKVTEKLYHCGQPTEFLRGWPWVNNDVVNVACAASGVLFAWLLRRFLW